MIDRIEFLQRKYNEFEAILERQQQKEKLEDHFWIFEKNQNIELIRGFFNKELDKARGFS